ncbi:MAG: glycine cleavage system protein GcvH, partial [bacterium]|nr:glycine cleavage system protein GcvH [bacterium]
VRWNGEHTLVGITDYAQQQLGDIVFVELPEVGSTVQKDETYGVIESVKAVSDLYAPITGEVVAVNSELADNPERINEDCYGDGWLLEVAPADAEERDLLLEPSAYVRFLDERDA